MIVTLTANPSIDRTVALAGPLVRGSVLRAEATFSQAGGKGVNISRACVAAGVPTLAVLPALAGDPFLAQLAAAGVPSHGVDTDTPVRVNLTISEPGGTTTKLNSPGTATTPAVLHALAAVLAEVADAADWVVLAGSLPPGVPPQWYSRLVLALRDHVRVAVDTSDEPLLALVAGLDAGLVGGDGGRGGDRVREVGAAPALMKPNADELASFVGGDPALLEADPDAAAAAARTLVDRGVETVLATLGAHGAVLVTADGAWHAAAPPTEVVSTVGAGDSSLFGYLLGDLRGLAPADRLALAVAYGSAAAALPGTTIPQPDDVHSERVAVRELAPDPRSPSTSSTPGRTRPLPTGVNR